MYLKQGDMVYRYTVKDNIMRVREGVVNIRGYGLYINFADGGQGVQCPRVEDIGVVRTAK